MPIRSSYIFVLLQASLSAGNYEKLVSFMSDELLIRLERFVQQKNYNRVSISTVMPSSFSSCLSCVVRSLWVTHCLRVYQ